MKHNCTVLIVDDEEDMLETCKMILEPYGFKIYTAVSPVQALEYIKSKNIDVVVTDLRMPEMDGLELISQIKEVSPRTEILVFTAYASIETAVESIKLGAFNYIQKPFSKEQFIELIKKAMETKKIYEEYNKLRDSFKATVFDRFIYSSNVMEDIVNTAKKIATSDINVFITGETGTGKEMIAKFIHKKSRRKNEKFVVVDMNTVNETLAESELFGYRKGAFTGAGQDRAGLMESANKGTLFIDEIGDINKRLQSKLLRVIEEKKVRRLGSNEEIFIDVRIISATNRDVYTMTKKGEFRKDLYYRLNTVHIHIPPLRERKDDIITLANFFMEGLEKIYRKGIEKISKPAMNKLLNYNWPGNVRELKNVIERAVILSNNDVINEEDIIFDEQEPSLSLGDEAHTLGRKQFLKNIDKQYLLKIIKKHNGNISAAAQEAGVHRSTIYRILKMCEKDEL